MKTHGLLFLLFLCGSAQAQIETVITDFSQAGGATRSIGHFSLLPGSIRWLVPGNSGLEGSSNPAGFGAKLASSFLPGVFSNARYCLNHTTNFPGTVQFYKHALSNDQHVYLSSEAGIWRKRLDAATADAPELFHSFSTTQIGGSAMMFMRPFTNHLIWAEASSTVIRFRYKLLSELATDPSRDMGELAGLPSNALHPVIRMESFKDNSESDAYGVALTSSGYLIRWYLPFATGQTLLASNVADFCLRTERSLTDNGVRIYAATNKPAQGAAAGKLLKINAHTGAVSTSFDTATLGANAQVLETAADESYLWIRVGFFQYSSGGLGTITTLQSSQILRAFRPAFSLSPPGTDTNFNPLAALPDGTNLRSDGQHLHWVEGSNVAGTWKPGHRIRRLKTDAPALVFNLEAMALEATQSTQNLNHDVQLVIGKPVTVRAWARTAADNTGRGPWFPEAKLRVFWNNAEVAGSPFPATQEPALGVMAQPAADRLFTMRGGNGHCFLFDVPGNVLVGGPKGAMKATFEVNGRRVLPESGPSPYANNAVTADLPQVVLAKPHCLLFIPIWGKDLPDWDYRQPGNNIGGILSRMHALMPTPGYSVRFATEKLALPHVRFGIPPWGYGPFDIGNPNDNDETACLNYLTALYLTHRNPPGCPDAHFVGAISPRYNDGVRPQFNGLGYTWVNTLLARMEPGDSSAGNVASYNLPLGGRTLAHELGHNYGIDHINQNSSPNAPAGGSGATPEGPYWSSYYFDTYYFGTPDVGGIAAAHYGYDPLTQSILRATDAADLLTYRPARWPSRLYNEFAGRFIGFQPLLAPKEKDEPPGFLEGDPLVYFVSGQLDLTANTATLSPLLRAQSSLFSETLIDASLAAGAAVSPHGYQLRQVNAAGTALQTVSLASATHSDTDSNAIIGQYILAQPGAVAVQVIKNGALVAEARASSNAPSITSTGAPVVDAATHSLRWQWNVSDADDDLVLCTVHYSQDNGATWTPLRMHDAASSIAVDTRGLAGSATARLRLLATDGFHTATTESTPFNLPKHAPELVVSGFTSGAKLNYGERRLLTVAATDAEDGEIAAGQLYWVVSGPTGATQFGPIFDPSALSPGYYGVTVVASDSDGEISALATLFTILPLPVPEGAAAPVMDGLAADPGYAGVKPVLLLCADGNRVAVRYFHHGGRLYVAASGLPYSASGLTRFGLRADRDSAGSATPQADDAAIAIDESGAASYQTGNGAAFVPATSLLGGFSSAVQAGEGAWNAELCFEDALLGGWSHDLRLMFFCGDTSGAAETTWPVNADPNSPASWSPSNYGNEPVIENAPPVAAAGSDRVESPTEARIFTLDGSGSSDPEGAAITHAWTQTSGPTVSLTGATTASASFSAGPVAASTSYAFQLIVNDGSLASDPDNISITLLPVTPSDWAPLAEDCRVTVTAAGAVNGCFHLLEPDFLGLGNPLSANQITSALWIVEKSPDMHVWTPVMSTSTNPTGYIRFTDNAASELRRFYRVRTAP